MVVVMLVSVCTWKLALSDVSGVLNCMAQEFLDSLRMFWQCRVLCDLVPEAVKDMGKLYLI